MRRKEGVQMKMNRERFKQILDEYYSHSPPTKFVLSVDFDHTLCYSTYPLGGKPTPVVKFLHSIADLDFVLIINTCRHTAVAEMIAKRWCRHYGIEWDYWNENDPARIARWGDCRKIACNMSIDDTDYNFNMEDFEE